MNKYIQKIIIFVILVIILSSVVSQNPNDTDRYNNKNDNAEIQDKTDLKSANSEITISTPENKTYIEPMSGYYPGTYGFENDKDGSIPREWVDPWLNTSVVASKEGHKKVLCLNDSHNSIQASTYQYFDEERTNGTVEFWIYFDGTHTSTTEFRIDGSSGQPLFSAGYVGSGWFYYYFDGIGNLNWQTSLPAAYEWFHVKIDFCSGGTYLGLTENRFRLRVHKSNGFLYFNSGSRAYLEPAVNTKATRFTLISDFSTIRKTWLDALGYSWDPKYNIGDNLDEGLLLSFKNSTTLDWKGYSLDGQVNKTILGNTTIPLPANGLHRIQVSGNSTLGEMYHSDVRHFSVYITSIPTSNHPEPILTAPGRSETINWTLIDDYGGGEYRVLANDTNGKVYVWKDWTSWENNTPLNVKINRTELGVYNYTIEYFDNHDQHGIPDTVIVTIKTNSTPISNHPGPITTYTSTYDNISWVLTDDFGAGQYRVLANDTNGNFYVWVNWTSWTNNTQLNVSINRAMSGVYNYTIEYYDDQNQSGIADTIIITIIQDDPPTSTHPTDITITIKEDHSSGVTGTVSWTLFDDLGGGEYRILGAGGGSGWGPWVSGVHVTRPFNKAPKSAVYYITIEYCDNHSQYGISDTIILRVILEENGGDDDDDEPNGEDPPVIPLMIFGVSVVGGIGLIYIFIRKSRISKNKIIQQSSRETG